MRSLRFSPPSFWLLLLGLALTPAAPSMAETPTPAVIEKAKLSPAKERPTFLEVTIDKSAPVSFDAPAATVFVANPDIADVQVISANSLMVFGKKTGQTTLIVTDDLGRKIVYKTIIVSQNLADLREALRTVIPGNNIKAEAIPNGIVLTGTALDSSAVEDARRLAARYLPDDGADIINRVQIKANNQVQIRVRFAEVSKDVDKRFGIDWEAIGSTGEFVFGLATGADFYTQGASTITRTVMGDSVNNALYGAFRNSKFNINGMIDALAKDGFVTILAEPSLTALSGQTASFLAGGEFPVPVPQSAETISIEWKQYGVSLAFTPTILNENRINLHVRPEVSQLSSTGAITLSNITIPALITRRAETTIELNSGQSFAIAGLLNNQQTQSIEKFPFLGDMPILGPLFRSSRFQNNESELVIIITPYIVKPTTEENLSLPTDGYTVPTDTEFFFGIKDAKQAPEASTISGPARAVRVKNPHAEEPAVPLSAPTPSVQKIQPPQTTASSEPQRKPLLQSRPRPTPSAPQASLSAPKGAGGFIVE